MIDARDLVLNEDIRNYWKKNDIFSSLKDQERLITRAYCPIEDKLKYLNEIGIRNSNLEEIYKEREYIRNCPYTVLYQYEEFSSSIGITCKEDEFGSYYRNPNQPIYLSFEDCIKKIYDKEFYIYESIFDENNKQFIGSYIVFYIDIDGEKRISTIEDNDTPVKWIDEFWYAKSNNIIPYTNIKLQTKNLDIPIEGTIETEIEKSGRQYISLKLDEYTNIGIDICTLRYKYFYNIYDWILEVK